MVSTNADNQKLQADYETARLNVVVATRAVAAANTELTARTADLDVAWQALIDGRAAS